ncbi:MAG: glycerate kinase [Chromatiaceae bacterium]|nr:glycerate kinase [Chromatiaceae bacterium]
MKIIIAPNALKGSCDASAAARAMARGLRRAAPQAELVEIPVADGGDGLLALAIQALGAERVSVRVTGPRFAPVTAALAWLPRRRLALIEMALASGLALLMEAERDPRLATSLGTGELMRAALDLGAETLVVGIGGSATNDGGIGMASALGWRFLDKAGQPVTPNGAGLPALVRIDRSGLDPRLARVRILAACDVNNPLTGPRGASAIYGPQKGASPAQVVGLDAGLVHLADLVEGRGRPGQRRWRDQPGAGAAGGLGFGLRAFCRARLRPGAELVLDILDFDARLAGADLVLTAEGRLDGQTLSGKAPARVAARARRLGIPCIALAGDLGADRADLDRLSEAGISAAISLCPGPLALAEAMARAEELLADAAEQVLRIFIAGRKA